MKIFVISFACVWFILLNTIDGVRGIEPGLLDTARAYGVKGRDRLRYVVVPAASPQISAGMRTPYPLAGPLRPPHLTALNPWEGFNDPYREAYAHGGIPETTWVPGWNHGLFSRRLVEDTATMMTQYPLMNAYWESKIAPVEDIDIPTYVVASWSDQGLHTRGTIEAFKSIGATQKWLDVHGRKNMGTLPRAPKRRLRPGILRPPPQGTGEQLGQAARSTR